MKMTGSVRSQIKSFLEGFYDVIPKNLISIFNEQELELLISGLPAIDIDDLKGNTEYHKYTETSLQVREREKLERIMKVNIYMYMYMYIYACTCKLHASVLTLESLVTMIF